MNHVELSRAAQRDLKRIVRTIDYGRIRDALVESLANDIPNLDVEPLTAAILGADSGLVPGGLCSDP